MHERHYPSTHHNRKSRASLNDLQDAPFERKRSTQREQRAGHGAAEETRKMSDHVGPFVADPCERKERYGSDEGREPMRPARSAA